MKMMSLTFAVLFGAWATTAIAAPELPKNPPEPTADYCNKKAAEIIAGEKFQAKVIENMNNPDNKPKTLDDLRTMVMMLHGGQSAQIGNVVVWYMLVGCDNKYLLNAYWDYTKEQFAKMNALMNKK